MTWNNLSEVKPQKTCYVIVMFASHPKMPVLKAFYVESKGFAIADPLHINLTDEQKLLGWGDITHWINLPGFKK
jgi:hypothetical protein